MIEIKRKGQAAAEMPAERAQMPAEGLDAQARGIHALSAEPALKREIRPFTGIDESGTIGQCIGRRLNITTGTTRPG